MCWPGISRFLRRPIQFHSKSGELTVVVEEPLITLNFPARKPEPSEAPQIILDAIQSPEPLEILKSRDYVSVRVLSFH